MKVTGPGSGQPPAAPSDGNGVNSVREVGRHGGTEATHTPEAATPQGTSFAEKLDRAHSRAASPAGRTGSVTDIGSELQAGRITAEAAIERVIHRVLDRQLGVGAPAAVREKVGAALRQAITDDPVLAEKVRALADR